MKIKDGYLLRQMGNTFAAIYAGDDKDGLEGMVSLNSVGAFIWKLLEKDCTADYLTNAVTEHYDIAPHIARSDIEKVLSILRTENILED